MSSHVLRRPQSLRRWQVRGLAATTGIMLGLGLAELLLRVFGFGTPPWSVVIHPFRGRSCRPDSTFVFRGEGGPRQIVLNSRGFRDLTRTPDKPAGIFRIAVLGDSYVEASHVDIADRVTERLERELNQRSVFGTSRVEVLNFGMAGYGTFNELQTLKHEAWNFQPDLVLVCFFSGNDLGNNCRELSQDSGRPYLVWRHDHFDELFPTAPRFSLRESILQSSHLFRLWTSVWEQRRESRKRSPQRQRQSPPHATSTESFEVGLDTQIYSPPKEAAWESAWEVTEELLRRFDQECRSRETPWLLVVLSNGVQVHPDRNLRESFRKAMEHPTLFYPEERLRQAAQRDGYPILCLAPELLNQAEWDQKPLHGFPNLPRGFGHWNARGHHAAARLIADFLQQFRGAFRVPGADSDDSARSDGR